MKTGDWVLVILVLGLIYLLWKEGILKVPWVLLPVEAREKRFKEVVEEDIRGVFG